jgi:succinylglutamic semialdehyde dehydrogenase
MTPASTSAAPAEGTIMPARADAGCPPQLVHPPANLIGGDWVPLDSGDLSAPGAVCSRNPAEPARIVYACRPRVEDVHRAVTAARAALPKWSALPRQVRGEVLQAFARLARARASALADLICDEVGKVLWEARQEAGLLASKVEITLDPAPEGGLRRVTDFELSLTPTRQGRCTFRAHGVMAVIGPFNFPAHLPNGHIVPALAMGNTVVFKPSDKAPGVGQFLAELFDEALRERLGGATIPGVINLVQGGAEVATTLVTHPDIDAIAFTGSWPVARRILEANLDRPGRLIALELGGSNPAVVMPDADLRLAAIEVVRCAFLTTGQRCTCTRRLIVHRDVAPRFISAVCKAASNLLIGHPRAQHPVFMGPINNAQARRGVLEFQARALAHNARALLEAREIESPTGGFFMSPGIILVDRFMPVEALDAGCDTEIFGPLLRVTVVDSLDQAIEQANATRYGLAASIFTQNSEAQARFLAEVRAGCININTGTAGASSKLPFGGLGLSGNHRPAGSFALDYCAVPVASMIEQDPITGATIPEGMRFEDAWLG